GAVDQREVVRRDRDPEVPRRRVQPGLLFGRQRQARRDLLLARDAVAQLPAPVVYLIAFGLLRFERGAFGRRVFAGRVRLVDDRKRECHQPPPVPDPVSAGAGEADTSVTVMIVCSPVLMYVCVVMPEATTYPLPSSASIAIVTGPVILRSSSTV